MGDGADPDAVHHGAVIGPLVEECAYGRAANVVYRQGDSADGADFFVAVSTAVGSVDIARAVLRVEAVLEVPKAELVYEIVQLQFLRASTVLQFKTIQISVGSLLSEH